MGVVKGTIALKDNATAVLQGIRKEQSAFRRDVEKTKSVLKATWDKKYQVRIEATAAHIQNSISWRSSLLEQWVFHPIWTI